MVLATRCPHCETVFRVQEAMLAGSGGFARCGHCHQVFDARSNLLDPHAGAHDGQHAATHAPSAPNVEGEPAAGEDREPAPTTEAGEIEAEKEGEIEHRAPESEPGPEAAAPVFEPPLTPEPPLAPEPPISAEVPPLAAPVFAPQSEHLPEVAQPEFAPAVEPEPAAEEAQPEPRKEAEPIEPARAEEPGALAQPTWTQHDPHWHDDEPRFNGRAPSEADVEPRFGASPATPAPSQQEPAVRAEPEFTPRRDPRDFDEAATEDEPHLEPHLRARLQAQAEEHAQAEPRFGAAADDTQVRAAGAPPIFPEPPASSKQERHFTVTRETRTRAPSRVFGYIVGGVIALALVVVLIAQLAWWRREAVMVYWPESQPLFARACAQLGCRLSPPRDIDGLQVEASDLRQVDGPHRLELRVPLRNRYGIALAYPAIELTLTDSKNDIAIRRVLWPQDYVAPGTPIAAGLPAHATQTMIVRLDSGNAIATNFRVQIFYP